MTSDDGPIYYCEKFHSTFDKYVEEWLSTILYCAGQTSHLKMTGRECKIHKIVSVLGCRRNVLSYAEGSQCWGSSTQSVKLCLKQLNNNAANLGAPNWRGSNTGLSQREWISIIWKVRQSYETISKLFEYINRIQPLYVYSVCWALRKVRIKQRGSECVLLNNPKQRRAQLA